jgi:tetratricopeptide (TPR) repeat protein
MERRDWRGARALLSRVCAAGGGPDVCQALALASFACGEWEASLQEMEEAYAGFRVVGRLSSAVQAATFLGFIYFALRGDVVSSHGWLRRAQRMCAELGDCVDEGYVALAIPACDVPNVGKLERSARKALLIARRFGDQDLEMRALADLGLALVSQGRVPDGLAMLEEATLAGVSGEVEFFSAGLIACSMLSGCVRAGDAERAQNWLERIDAYLADAELTVLQSHCQITLGCVLALIGRWTEAEGELERAIASCARTSLPLRAWAVGALA